MQRRTVLASIGSVLGITATAGCLGSAAPGANDGEGDDPTDSPTSDPTTREPTQTDEQSTTDGDSASDSTTAFAGVGCPSFRESVDRTVCSTTADLDNVPVSLVPEQSVFEPTTGDDSVEALTVTLTNHSDGSFGFNPYAWTLHRHDDNGWTRVAPDAWPEPWTTLESGQRYTYELSVKTHPSPNGEDRMDIQQDLDSGVYALSVDGDDDGERIECVAVFAVEREN